MLEAIGILALPAAVMLQQLAIVSLQRRLVGLEKHFGELLDILSREPRL